MREAVSADARASFWRRHRLLVWTAGALLTVLIVAAALVSVALHDAEPYLRARMVAELEARFHARVELGSFQVSLMNGLWAEGKGLRIWPSADENATSEESQRPLIRVKEFRFHAPLHYEPGKPFYISLVRLKGLDVNVPPKMSLSHAMPLPGKAQNGAGAVRITVGTIECTGARLTLETSDPGKPPLVFAIARLKLTGVNQAGKPMGFNAELTNPRPRGTIFTHGRFGPWEVDDPGSSPIAGQYRFEHANLATFKGIAGILSSTGNYEGTLRRLTVDGKTETPDFRLSTGGQPMNLRTRFHAQVDGMNGDTRLEPVVATLGHSHLTARGEVVRVRSRPGEAGKPGGHDVVLKVNVESGRIEDFLKVAARGEPVLTGALTMQTSLDVPPGSAPVADRLLLHGHFVLADARFTSAKIQNRIEELSLRGQGRPNGRSSSAATQVRSTMQSGFQMASGVITLPNLKYTVPGAEIDLKGKYGVAGGSLDFTGTAKMQATISQMVGGWKGLLLTPLDRLFEKGGAGTVVPVTIEGTRKAPRFSVDFGGLKKTVPQRPEGIAGSAPGRLR